MHETLKPSLHPERAAGGSELPRPVHYSFPRGISPVARSPCSSSLVGWLTTLPCHLVPTSSAECSASKRNWSTLSDTGSWSTLLRSSDDLSVICHSVQPARSHERPRAGHHSVPGRLMISRRLLFPLRKQPSFSIRVTMAVPISPTASHWLPPPPSNAPSRSVGPATHVNIWSSSYSIHAAWSDRASRCHSVLCDQHKQRLPPVQLPLKIGL